MREERGPARPPYFMGIVQQYRRNPFLTGTIHANEREPDKFTMQSTEELSRLQAFCRQRKEDTRFDKRDGMVHAAEVPIQIYEQAVREGWDNADGWKRWMNDPANKCFRTWEGKV